MKRKWISLLLCAVMAASSASCSKAPQEEAPKTEVPSSNISAVSDEEFEGWLNEYIVEVCENDYTTAHHYFEKPEDYGIDVSKARITLGSYTPDEEDEEFTASVLRTLNGWKTDNLNDTNRKIFEQLYWMYDVSQRSSDEKFTYLEPIWSQTSGVPGTLTDFFSEYQLFTKNDIDPLVELINDVPRYVETARDYSEKQAELGLFRLNEEDILTVCENMLATSDDSPVTHELYEEVDALGLSEEETDAAKKKIDDALQASFFPSFQTMIDIITSLEDKIVPIEGLAAYENGQEYYEILLEYYTGSEEKEKDIYDNLYKAMNSLSLEYRSMTKENEETVAEGLSLTTPFTKVSEIMPFLEDNYGKLFPSVPELSYEIKPLSNEQAKDGVVAYFVVPPIDSERTYEIRYNARDYGDDPSAISFYNTMAHEGIPGHMYQTQFEKDNFTLTAQYFLNCMGMQEGYATYAAFQANDWLKLNDDAKRVWYINETYSNMMILLMDLQINYDGVSLEEFQQIWDQDLTGLYNQLAENPGIFFSYYYGCYQIEQLEQKAKDALGDRFSPIAFNEALLRNGNLKFSLIEESIQEYIDSIGVSSKDKSSASDADEDKESTDSDSSDSEDSEAEAV